MQEAINASMKQTDGGPFGAVIVKDDEIVAVGWNRVTSTNDPTAHAEMEAIRKACKKLNTFDLSGCVLYTSCEPCPMCASAIFWAHIDKVYYACTTEDAADIDFDDSFIYEQLKMKKLERKIPFIHLEQERKKAIKAMQKWYNNPNRIDY